MHEKVSESWWVFLHCFVFSSFFTGALETAVSSLTRRSVCLNPVQQLLLWQVTELSDNPPLSPQVRHSLNGHDGEDYKHSSLVFDLLSNPAKQLGERKRTEGERYGDRALKQEKETVTGVLLEVGDGPVWSRWERPWCTCAASGKASGAWWGRPGRRTPPAAGCDTPSTWRQVHSQITSRRKEQSQ